MADMVRVGGTRRIDRVLAPDFLDGLADLPLPEVRALRAEAEQEEVDLSFLRKLLHARMDLLDAEIRRRGVSGEGDLVAQLPSLLAEPRSSAHGRGRHSTVEPSRADSHRRQVEALAHGAGLHDLSALSDDGLRDGHELLAAEERQVSDSRRAVQQVMDACSAEVGRRYREGTADVADLLGDAGAAR